MKLAQASALRSRVADGMTLHPAAARVGMAVVAAVFVALMAAMAGLWSNATTLERVTTNARELHAANATAGAAGITRAAVALAVVFEADRQVNVATQADVDVSIAEARAALESFERAINTAAPLETTTAFSSAVVEILDKLETADVRSAVSIRNDRLEPAYSALVADLTDRQNTAEQAILDTQTSAGRTARVTQVFIILAIPAGAMLSYWLIVRRRLREQEVDMRSRLEAEQAVSAAKDELIAGISHELRTPLTGIHGFSEILMTQGLADQEMAMDLVSIIHSESGELSRMIDDLLTAARIDAGELGVAVEPTELALAIDSVLQPVLRQGRNVAASCPPLWVAADPLRLRQILRNLISNAAKHGGDNIAVIVDQSKGMARITVADDGPGVSEDIIARLFDRFVNGGRGALLAGSVGLGLAVARDLVERMGGRIAYKRIDDITMFEIEVPLAPTPVSGEMALT
ncbi:MAG: sensor histidine kinase [Acidimicrobiia bacterium]